MLCLFCGCKEAKSIKKVEAFGIDVSHHNGTISWKKVPDVQFVYIKATEGATYVDSHYQRNVRGARARSLLVGSYHYFRTTSSAHAQFENFKKHVAKSEQDLIPLVDVEECKNWSKEQFRDSLRVFIELVEQEYGVASMIYSVNSFYNKYCAPAFNRYHLMIGRYGKNPSLIKGTGSYTIWQKSESGKLVGIPKSVDIDVIHSKYTLDDILIAKKKK